MARLSCLLLGLLALAVFAASALAQPAPVIESRRAAAAAPRPRAAVQAAPNRAMATSPAPMTVEEDEATATSQLNAWLVGQSLGQSPLGTVTAQELAVQFQDDQVVVTGTAQAGQVRLPVELTATATVNAGSVQVALRSAQVSGVPLPEGTRREIEQRVQDELDQSIGSSRFAVQSVHIGQGKLTIVGTPS